MNCIFLVAGRISSNQWQITPPATNKQAAEVGKECTVYLKSNTVSYNNHRIDLNKENSFSELKKQCADNGVIIASPNDLPAERMIMLLNKAKEQGFKKVKILVMSHY
ncbi:biopolymer transporter ExbD [Piscirickettsia litoralis]|uniref:biopolymer transporter ExbD n=1 Tax=Piscirickettsia litoralis TaxID=1891921 RepID=UPI00373FD460